MNGDGRAAMVQRNAVALATGDSYGLDGEDLQHSTAEHRSQRIGRSMTGRILFVVYTLRRAEDEKETIRIISARQASRKEREAYSRFTD
ncbi:BrnT family toxin [Nitrospira sp. Nam80]